MDTEKIKERIRKLLAKADNTACTVEEASAFNDKAYELMAQYNLDRAMVEGVEEGTKRNNLQLKVLVRPWSKYIIHGLCKLYHCKWVYKQEGRTHIVTIVGEENNVVVCHAVTVFALRAVQQAAKGQGRSFLTGAGGVIYTRCEELLKQQEGHQQSKALVVYTGNEDKENQAYLEELLGHKPKQARKSTAQVRSAAAFNRGAEFGKTVPLQQARIK